MPVLKLAQRSADGQLHFFRTYSFMNNAAALVVDHASDRHDNVYQPINTTLPADRLFSIQGRIGVLRHNARIILSSLAFLVAAVLISVGVSFDSTIVAAITVLPALALILGAFAVIICSSIKRLHDLGFNGWLNLITFLPVIGILWSLYYTLKPGKDEPNQYGAKRDATASDKIIGIIGIVLSIGLLVGAFIFATRFPALLTA